MRQEELSPHVELLEKHGWKGLILFMVLIAIIIFGITQTFGQDWDKSIDSIKAEIDLYQVVRVIDFIDYQRQCYNDSTEEYGRIIRSQEDSTMFILKRYYSHRAPTFEGFIDYLKDKADLRYMRRLREQMRRKVE